MQKTCQVEQEEGDLNFLWLVKFLYLTRCQVEDCSIGSGLVTSTSPRSIKSGWAGIREETMRYLPLLQD